MPSLHVEDNSCHVKQYFQEGRALRTETTINGPTDLRVRKDISNLAYLQKIGREVNRRLRDVQRVSQDGTLAAESVTRVVQPTGTDDGQRASGLALRQYPNDGPLGGADLVCASVQRPHPPHPAHAGCGLPGSGPDRKSVV